MIIISAFSIITAFTTYQDGYSHYQQLSDQLAQQIEWIDNEGSTQMNRNRAVKILSKLSLGASKIDYSLRHCSKWKNGKCFKIIHINKKNKGYRVFFQCSKIDSQSIVTKIKVTELPY